MKSASKGRTLIFGMAAVPVTLSPSSAVSRCPPQCSCTLKWIKSLSLRRTTAMIDENGKRRQAKRGNCQVAYHRELFPPRQSLFLCRQDNMYVCKFNYVDRCSQMRTKTSGPNSLRSKMKERQHRWASDGSTVHSGDHLFTSIYLSL